MSSLWLALLFLLLVLPFGGAALAQLPAGTSDSAQSPQKDNSLRAEANAALSKQDYTTALKLLTALAAESPADARLLFDLGFTRDALDQSAPAEQSYRRAIAADATYFEPHLALGLLLARNGKAAEARTELASATTFNTVDPLLRARAYRALARLDQSSRPADASAELLAAMKLSPESPDDILLSGEMAEAAGDLAAAEAAYRRSLASDPQSAAAAADLSHLMQRHQRPDQAEATLTAALARNSDDPTLNAELASLYDQQDKPAQAVPLIEKLHAAHPEDQNLTRLLARLYTRNQQFAEASPLYTALLARSPEDPALLDDSANVLIHLRKPAEAEILLRRALANPAAFATKEDLGMAASHMAFAASEINDPVATLRALEIRATVLPQSPSSLFLAATAHDKLHQAKVASDLYKQFLSVAGGKFPDEEWEARHRLLTLEHMK